MISIPPEGAPSHISHSLTVGLRASSGIGHLTYSTSLNSSIILKFSIHLNLKDSEIALSQSGSTSINFLRSCFSLRARGASLPGIS